MLESELAKKKTKRKVVGILKIDLDKMRNKINILEEKIDKKKGQDKAFERKERTARASQLDD